MNSGKRIAAHTVGTGGVDASIHALGAIVHIVQWIIGLQTIWHEAATRVIWAISATKASVDMVRW